MLTLDVENVSFSAGTDYKFGSVTIPAGYTPILADYVDNSNGTGWGGITIHISKKTNLVYGSSTIAVGNCSGTVYIVCDKQ